MIVEIDHEDVDWLPVLLAAYRQEHNDELDDDSGATAEMVDRCEKAIKALLLVYPFDPAGGPQITREHVENG